MGDRAEGGRGEHRSGVDRFRKTLAGVDRFRKTSALCHLHPCKTPPAVDGMALMSYLMTFLLLQSDPRS